LIFLFLLPLGRAFSHFHTLGRLPAGPTFFASPKKVAKKRDLRKTAFFLRTFSFTFRLQKQQCIIFRLPPEWDVIFEAFSPAAAGRWCVNLSENRK